MRKERAEAARLLFAVAARYDDLLLPDREDATRNLEIVERLRHDVYATFPENAIPR